LDLIPREPTYYSVKVAVRKTSLQIFEMKVELYSRLVPSLH